MRSEISPSQLRALYLVSILSPMIRLVPGYPAYLAGRGAILSPLLALVPELVYALFFYTQLNRGGDLCTRIREGGGGWFLLILGLWLSFYSGFILRTAAERLLSTIYKDGSRYFFVAAILAVALLGAKGRVRTLGRAASVFLPVIGAVLVLSCVFGIGDAKWEYILPVTLSDLSGAAKGALPIFDVTTVGIYFLLFPVKEAWEKGLGRKILLIPPLLTAILTLLQLAVMADLSVPITGSFRNPFFVMVQNLNVFGRAERVEAVAIALWLITDYLYLSVMLRASGEAMRSALGGRSVRPAVLAAGGGAFVSAFLCGRSTFSVVPLSGFWVPAINLFFTLAALPFMILICKLRKNTICRTKTKQKKQNILLKPLRKK